MDWKELINEIPKLDEFEPDEQDVWQKYFEDHKENILDLKNAISKIDDRINQLVYDLYNFTPEEIIEIESNYPTD